MSNSAKIWLSVSVAWSSAVWIPVETMISLASGYGYKAFNIWRPPETDSFRAGLFVVSMILLGVGIICALAVLVRGRMWQRVAVVLPLLFDLLVVGLVVWQSFS